MTPFTPENHHFYLESREHGPLKLLYYTNHESFGLALCRVHLHDGPYRTITIDHDEHYDETPFRSFSSVEQKLNSSLPKCDIVEPADWDLATLSTHSATHAPYLYQPRKTPSHDVLPTVWHPTIIQLKDLNFDVSNRVGVPDCPAEITGIKENVSPVIFNGEVCVPKLDKWNILPCSNESRIYRQLEGKNIAPDFLGHIAEGNVIVGFLLRAICGRAARTGDLSFCKDLLGRFHQLGFVQEIIQVSNFIVTETDGSARAWIVDFEVAESRRDFRPREAWGEMMELKRLLSPLPSIFSI